MTDRELKYELGRVEMKLRDSYRCPNCNAHWVKLVVTFDNVIRGCEMCKGRLDKSVKYHILPMTMYIRDSALEVMKSRGLI